MSNERIHPNRKYELDTEWFKAWRDRTRKGIEHALKVASWIMLSAGIGAVAKKTDSNWVWAAYGIVVGLVIWYITTFLGDVISYLLNRPLFKRIPWEVECAIFCLSVLLLGFLVHKYVSQLSSLILSAIAP